MKHLKIFENNENTCTEDEFINFQMNRRKIYSLLSKYMRLHPEILTQKKIREIQSITIVQYNIFDDCVDIDYYIDYPESENTITLKTEEYFDLLEFMENPELYKTSKKYNL